LPTVCELAGVEIPNSHKLDGESQTKALSGEVSERKSALFWEWRFRIAGEPFHHSPELAIREGQWKLYMNPDGSRVELYDMLTDLTQLNNVAEKNPELVKRLSTKLLGWAKTLPNGPRDPGAGQMTYPKPPLLRKKS
jgi:arylsulfatase A-like enzyme